MLQKFQVEKFDISPTQLFSQHNNKIATIKTQYEPKKLAKLLGTWFFFV